MSDDDDGFNTWEASALAARVRELEEAYAALGKENAYVNARAERVEAERDAWEATAQSHYKEAYALRADVGDSQFWVDRRVACISGGYPPSEANYVSIQEYVKALEKELDTIVVIHLNQP